MQNLSMEALPNNRASTAPNWAMSTLGCGHRGRARSSFHPVEALSVGLGNFFAAPEPIVSPRRHHRQDPPACSTAEPVILNCHRSYYVRRQAHPDGLYRRHLATAPLPNVTPRKQGKRFVPECKGLVPRIQGTKQFPELQERQAGQLEQEPQLHHIRRLAKSKSQERTLEESLHRKISVSRESYWGSGRAGDLSQVFSPPPRVEDFPEYQHHAVESPTFLRFCKSLPPPPAVSPHQRHRQLEQKRADKENQSALEAVAQLDSWEERHAGGTAAPPAIAPPVAGGKSARTAGKPPSANSRG